MKNIPSYEFHHDKAANTVIAGYAVGIDDTPPHFHRCFEILYTTEKSAYCEVGSEKFVSKKDDIIFVHKCAIHAFTSEFTKRYVIIIGAHYSDDFVDFFNTETLPAHLADKQFNRTLRPYFKALCNLPPNASPIVKKGYLNIIMGSLLEHYEHIIAKPSPQLGTIINALNYIDEHYKEDISLESISAEFGYNKFYFSRLFNTYIGENLNHYINMIRLQNIVTAAKKGMDCTLSELVFTHGFDSMTTFYRSYYQFYNRPPSDLLKKGGFN